MFRTVPLYIIRSFSLYKHNNGVGHTGLLTACEQDQDVTRFHPDPVEFQSKNKFEKLMHIVCLL